MQTKVYCDIADIKIIKKYNKVDLVKGFTTNPSLMRKAGAKNYEKYAKNILKVSKNKPVSLEVFADNDISMLKQAKKINSWGKNVFVKIPVINSKGKSTSNVIRQLSKDGQEKTVAVIDKNNKIIGSINPSKIINTVFGGRKKNN